MACDIYIILHVKMYLVISNATKSSTHPGGHWNTVVEVVDTAVFERVNIVSEKTRTFESKYLSLLHRRQWRPLIW